MERSSQPAKTGHFYLATNRTFLLGVDMDGEPLAAWVHITRYNGGLFYERSGPGPSGKTRKENHDP